MKKLAVITGASKGIGLAMAKRFVAEGYRVINLARTAAEVQEVENISTDLSQEDFLAEIKSKLDALIPQKTQMVLVHNAFLYIKDNIANAKKADLKKMMQVALIAPAELNQALLPKMAEGSAIIYIGSTLSEKAVANAYSYSMTKHATLGLMRATCQDLFGKGIHTVCLCPGTTKTELFMEHVKSDAHMIDSFAKMTAFNRLVEPAELAEVALHAAQSPVLNGTIIHANLGQREV